MVYQSRRAFIRTWFALPASMGLAIPLSQVHAMGEADPTHSCEGVGSATRSQTEGPYFTSNTPLKQDFLSDDPTAQPFTLLGFVLNAECQPQANALIELWHADTKGEYDNSGYRLRGHQYSDKQGRFAFETGLPGKYPGRTRHFHVKVLAKGQRELTTQLYFPDDPNNDGDSIFHPSLIMDVTTTSDGQIGRYNFVL